MEPRERFAALARLPDAEIDVAGGALLIAAEAYPDLDPARYERALSEQADLLRPSVEDGLGDAERAARLLAGLHETLGYTGNEDAYYDPRNSFLNEVIDRRKGIPITLSIVALELARRLSLTLSGVGFPGHFLLRLEGERPVLLDAFHGSVLTREECSSRLRRALGPGAVLGDDHIAPASPREILFRVLNNLKAIYVRGSRYEDALSCCDRMLLLVPDEPMQLRDRGLLYHRLECFGAAAADLDRFLELAPHDPLAATIREQLAVIRTAARRVN